MTRFPHLSTPIHTFSTPEKNAPLTLHTTPVIGVWGVVWGVMAGRKQVFQSTPTPHPEVKARMTPPKFPTTRRASEDAEVFHFLSQGMNPTQIAYSTGWSLAKAKAVIARVTAKETTA